MIEFSQSSIDDIDENYIGYMFVSASQMRGIAEEFKKFADELAEYNNLQQEGRYLDKERFLGLVRFYIDKGLIIQTDQSLTVTIISLEIGDIFKRSLDEVDKMELQSYSDN
jgi:hypothetical protein